MNVLLDCFKYPIFGDEQMQISKILSECIIITIFIRFQESDVAHSM